MIEAGRGRQRRSSRGRRKAVRHGFPVYTGNDGMREHVRTALPSPGGLREETTRSNARRMWQTAQREKPKTTLLGFDPLIPVRTAG